MHQQIAYWDGEKNVAVDSAYATADIIEFYVSVPGYRGYMTLEGYTLTEDGIVDNGNNPLTSYHFVDAEHGVDITMTFEQMRASNFRYNNGAGPVFHNADGSILDDRYYEYQVKEAITTTKYDLNTPDDTLYIRNVTGDFTVYFDVVSSEQKFWEDEYSWGYDGIQKSVIITANNSSVDIHDWTAPEGSVVLNNFQVDAHPLKTYNDGTIEKIRIGNRIINQDSFATAVTTIREWLDTKFEESNYDNIYYNTSYVLDSDNEEAKTELINLYRTLITTTDLGLTDQYSADELTFTKSGNDLIISKDETSETVTGYFADPLNTTVTTFNTETGLYEINEVANLNMTYDFVVGCGDQTITLGEERDILLNYISDTRENYVSIYAITENADGSVILTRTTGKPGQFGSLTDKTIDTLTITDFIENGEGKVTFQGTIYKDEAATISLIENAINTTSNKNKGIYFNPLTPVGGEELQGTWLNESFTGTTSADTIYGNGGDDSIDGGKGDDVIYGGDGDDFIEGKHGSDTIYGNDGNDTLKVSYASAGDINTIYGGKGNDTINVTSNNDDNIAHVYAQEGEDSVVLHGKKGTIYLHDLNSEDSLQHSVISQTEGGAEYSYARVGQDLVITQTNNTNTQTMIIENHFTRLAEGTQLDAVTIGGEDISLLADTTIIVDLNLPENATTADEPYVATAYNEFITGSGFVLGATEKTMIYMGEECEDNASCVGNDITFTYRYEEGGAENNITIQDFFNDEGDFTFKGQCLVDGDNNSYEPLAYSDITLAVSGRNTFKNIITVEEVDYTIFHSVNITGTDGNDIYIGGDGRDTINGVDGKDTIYGGAGDDVIYGGDGRDAIYGGDDDDIIYGGDDSDTIYGGTGDDIIYGSTGTSADEAIDRFYFNLGDGTDTIKDAENADRIYIDSVIDANSINFTRNSEAKLEIKYSDNDKIIIDNFNFADVNDNINAVYIKNAKGTYNSISIAQQKIDVILADGEIFDASGNEYKLNITVVENGSASVLGLKTTDTITIAGVDYTRTDDSGLILKNSDTNTQLEISDFFDRSMIGLKINDVPVSAETEIAVTLTGILDVSGGYEATIYHETISGNGKVFGLGTADKLSYSVGAEETMLLTRNVDGNNADAKNALVISGRGEDELIITDFFTDNKCDTLNDEAIKNNANINVVLENNALYTAETNFYETISGTGSVSALNEDDKVAVNDTLANLTYKRNGNDLVINDLCIKDYYTSKNMSVAGQYAGITLDTTDETDTTLGALQVVTIENVSDIIGNGNDETITLVSGAVNENDDVLSGNTYTSNADGNEYTVNAYAAGKGGNDTITGAANANSWINGGAGSDVIYGGSGTGHDMLSGDAGNDEINVNSTGSTEAYGGSGNDQITAQVNTGTNFIWGGQGNDEIQLNGGSNTIMIAGEDTGFVEKITNPTANDTLKLFINNGTEETPDYSGYKFSELRFTLIPDDSTDKFTILTPDNGKIEISQFTLVNGVEKASVLDVITALDDEGIKATYSIKNDAIIDVTLNNETLDKQNSLYKDFIIRVSGTGSVTGLGENDIITFNDELANLTYKRNGNDLVINDLCIKDYYTSKNMSVAGQYAGVTLDTTDETATTLGALQVVTIENVSDIIGNGNDETITLVSGAVNENDDVLSGNTYTSNADGNEYTVNAYAAGLGGDDTIKGVKNANNWINGGAGNDAIYGGSGTGHDMLSGDAGNDEINVNSTGSTEAYGGSGNDTFNVQTGTNFIWGGQGNDEIQLNGGSNTIMIAGEDAGFVEKITNPTANDTLKLFINNGTEETPDYSGYKFSELRFTLIPDGPTEKFTILTPDNGTIEVSQFLHTSGGSEKASVFDVITALDDDGVKATYSIKNDAIIDVTLNNETLDKQNSLYKDFIIRVSGTGSVTGLDNNKDILSFEDETTYNLNETGLVVTDGTNSITVADYTSGNEPVAYVGDTQDDISTKILNVSGLDSFDGATQGTAFQNLNIIVSGTDTITNLKANDNITLADGTLSRTWNTVDNNTLTIASGNNIANITDYFNEETYPAFTLNDSALPTALNVTLNDTTNEYETDDRFVESISGVGIVATTALTTANSDKLSIEGTVTYERIHNGDLHVKGTGSDITVTGFDFDNATTGNIYVNDSVTSAATVIKTTVTHDLYYATAYTDDITVTTNTKISGLAKGIDSVTIGGEKTYKRTVDYLFSDDLVIEGDYTVTLRNFFATEGDITVDGSGTFGNVLNVTAYRSYTASDNYKDNITVISNNMAVIDNLKSDDILNVEGITKYYRNSEDALWLNDSSDDTRVFIKDFNTNHEFTLYNDSQQVDFSKETLTVEMSDFDATTESGNWGFGTFNITGGSTTGTLKGGEGDDTITAGAIGSDIYGNGGNDLISGSTRNDMLDGGAGSDTINGGEGKDAIYGGEDGDLIYGGEGSDTIYGGAGDDTIYGGTGTGFDESVDRFHFSLGDGTDIIKDAENADRIYIDSVIDTDSIRFTRNSDAQFEINYSDNDKIIIDNFNFADIYDNINVIFVKNSEDTYTSVNIAQQTIDVILADGEIFNASGKEYKLNVTVAENGTASVSGLKTTDSITVADAVLERTDNGGLVIGNSDTNTQLTVSDFFNRSMIGLKINDVPVSAETQIAVTLTGALDVSGGYEATMYTETISGTGKVFGLGENDTLKLSSETTYLLNTDGLTVSDSDNNSITVTDYTVGSEPAVYVGETADVIGNKTLTVVGFDEFNALSDSFNFHNINITGADSSVSYIGSTNSDSLTGSTANDYIDGNRGDDTIISGNGADTLYGNWGEDVIDGGADNDLIYGGDGDDYILGGEGNDTVHGGNGDDIILADEGDDIIYGQNGDDTIYGISGNNEIYAGGGDDFILGGSDNETIYSGSGNDSVIAQYGVNYINLGEGDDTVLAGQGDDTIFGGEGNDSITASVGNDYVDAGTGNDFVYAGEGNDIVYARGGDDTIYGQNGNDTIYAIAGNNKIYAGAGNDSIIGGVENDTLDGGDGDDIITGVKGDNYITAGAGNDTVYGGAGNDTIYGGNDNDLLYGSAGNDYIDGGTGDDSIDGGAGDDIIYARGGNNTIYGQNGDDTIYAIAGNNKIYAGAGNDSIIGGAENDYIDAGTGDDYVNAGAGDDIIYAIGGNDTIIGNSGDDTIYGIAGNNKLYGSAGNDSIIGGVENDTLDGGDGNDTITDTKGDNYISAGAGDDFVTSGIGDDTIYGGAGNDLIYDEAGDDYIDGGAGDDTISGGAGNDTILGKIGNNKLYGGSGNDLYIVDTNLSESNTIFDEAGNEDIISVTEVNKDDLVLRFDLKVDSEGHIIDGSSQNMYITKIADFGNTEKGIKVTNQFTNYSSIETITTADDYALTTTELNQLRENVAGWLYENGFESVQQILDSGDETNINNLIAEFQKADWHSIV